MNFILKCNQCGAKGRGTGAHDEEVNATTIDFEEWDDANCFHEDYDILDKVDDD